MTPPRLSVIFASEAPRAVVFRRGSSKVFQIFVWHRDTDTFEPGSVFKGKLYPDRSDISPDGRLLLYFAMGGVAWAIPETGGTWTAISRLSELKAIALWAHSGTTWVGDGLFTSNSSYWMDDDLGWETSRLRETADLRRDRRKPAMSRTEREGWVESIANQHGYLSEKILPAGWLLRQRFRRARQYELENHDSQVLLTFPNWQWADWDRHRLTRAEEGILKAARLHSRGFEEIEILKNFCF